MRLIVKTFTNADLVFAELKVQMSVCRVIAACQKGRLKVINCCFQLSSVSSPSATFPFLLLVLFYLTLPHRYFTSFESLHIHISVSFSVSHHRFFVFIQAHIRFLSCCCHICLSHTYTHLSLSPSFLLPHLLLSSNYNFRSISERTRLLNSST